MPAEQQLLVPEERYITPLIEVLTDVAPKPANKSVQLPKSSKSLQESLDALFPEQGHQEKAIKVARETLGNIAEYLSPEQLRDTVAEIQFLADSWLDDFERKTFGGLTLKELLHEKGGL